MPFQSFFGIGSNTPFRQSGCPAHCYRQSGYSVLIHHSGCSPPNEVIEQHHGTMYVCVVYAKHAMHMGTWIFVVCNSLPQYYSPWFLDTLRVLYQNTPSTTAGYRIFVSLRCCSLSSSGTRVFVPIDRSCFCYMHSTDHGIGLDTCSIFRYWREIKLASGRKNLQVNLSMHLQPDQ